MTPPYLSALPPAVTRRPPRQAERPGIAVANLGIAVAKVVAAPITGSARRAAEAAHSNAETRGRKARRSIR